LTSAGNKKSIYASWFALSAHFGFAGKVTAAVAIAAVVALGSDAAFTKGGTAKPPGGGGGGGAAAGAACTTTVPNCISPVLPPAGPVLLAPATSAAGFSITGFAQNVTVNGGCQAPIPGNPNISGGTVTVNGTQITIPSNTIVQFPANTLTWHDAVCPVAGGASPLEYSIALDGTGGQPTAAPGPQPGPILGSVEVRVDGNVIGPGGAAPTGAVGERYIGALVYFNQQSANASSGYISFIDYTDGSIYVRSAAAGETRLLINDPAGRFGRPQSSTDARFQVDDENPTIKAAASGYPLCVPRRVTAGGAVIPTVAVTINGTVFNIPNDPLCPLRNRPISGLGAGAPCRNFAAAGVAPIGGELTPTPAGRPCTAFVMKAVAGMPGTGTFANPGPNIMAAGDPDPREQVPLMVGDFINWAGTLVRGGNARPPVSTRPTTTGGPGNGDVIWVHTIDANVGVYTQPRTLPAYIAVGEFVVGVDPQPTGVAALPGVEATARISLEASVSDVGSIVDIYWDDKGFTLPAPAGPLVPLANSEYLRWLTMEALTGTLTDLNIGKNVYLTSPQPFGGGIATQFTGPQPGRARIRANKVTNIVENAALACPPTGGSQNCAITNSPSRNIRVVIRSLCAPASTGTLAANGVAVPSTNIDTGGPGPVVANSGRFFAINGPRVPLNGAIAGDGTCLQSAQFANGLFTGQYLAPVGEYIYPEPTLGGSPILPNNFYQLGFLIYGEGGDGSTAQQNPRPW
jgi:hypothetical protein